MNTYIGIDLGTSSVKLLLTDPGGRILNSVCESYPISYPRSGWSEQNPSDWFDAVMRGIKRLTACGIDGASVNGISFGGQMHGLVILDREDNVIRPAILWNDGRTQAQTNYLNNVIGKDKLSDMTANIAFAGFTAPKILWIKENEPQSFERIAKIMLPKDYIAFKLSGAFATDYSDASGTLLLDVKNRKWAQPMCSICGIKPEWLPTLRESYEVTGSLKPDIASTLGLNLRVKIIAGAGDNAAAAVGTDTVGDGQCNISIGTSGTIFISSDSFTVDSKNALHSFCHADGQYHLMGCMLSAASCYEWWILDILRSDRVAEQAGIDGLLGKNDVFFMPYLMGERSPYNDVNARGAFIGMRPDSSRAKMTLAVLEGVAFGIRDCFEIAKSNGIEIERTKICGGGAKSPLWKKIFANVLGIPVDVLRIEEGPAYGGAILAMVGCGEYDSVAEATKACVQIKETIEPDDELIKLYNEKYAIFKELYPALKYIFSRIKG